MGQIIDPKFSNFINGQAHADGQSLRWNNATSSYEWYTADETPFVDSTAIIKGSADATKLLRIEVDGFTTATTRVLTPPNANATIAGLEVAQTFTSEQTFQAPTSGKAAVFKAAATTPGNTIECQDAAGAVVAYFTPSGDLGLNGRVGIGTATPSNILSLGNAQNQKIWIENTNNLTAGKSLTIAASGTVNTSPSTDPNFVALSQTSRNWLSMTAHSNGNVYAGVDGGDIYMQLNFAGGTADLAGGNLILSSGVGKGTGESSISFKTSTTLTSGTDLQVLSEKMTILGSGNVGIGTTAPGAMLQINAGAAGTIGQIIRGAASQTANLQDWQNSAGTVLAKVDSAGGVTIGSGTLITKVLSATATLDFPSTIAGAVADLTIALTGAALGDTVSLGVPNGAMTATADFFGWVSAADTVTVRYSPKATEDPASGTFRVTIIKF